MNLRDKLAIGGLAGLLSLVPIGCGHIVDAWSRENAARTHATIIADGEIRAAQIGANAQRNRKIVDVYVCNYAQDFDGDGQIIQSEIVGKGGPFYTNTERITIGIATGELVGVPMSLDIYNGEGKRLGSTQLTPFKQKQLFRLPLKKSGLGGKEFIPGDYVFVLKGNGKTLGSAKASIYSRGSGN